MNYISGAKVDGTGGMHGIDEDCALIIRLVSQMPKFFNQPEKKSLELKFIGLYQLNFFGYQKNHFCDIFSCYLSFYKDLIVWANDEIFDPENICEATPFNENVPAFVFAQHLEWRFL